MLREKRGRVKKHFLAKLFQECGGGSDAVRHYIKDGRRGERGIGILKSGFRSITEDLRYHAQGIQAFRKKKQFPLTLHRAEVEAGPTAVARQKGMLFAG